MSTTLWGNEEDGASQALSPHILCMMTLHDYVTAEITYSTVHAHHEVLAWTQSTFVI